MKVKYFSLILAVIIFITAIFVSLKFNYPTKYYSLISKYAKEYNLEKALVFAVIKTESNFDKNAKSNAGAMGLMQIMPQTAKFISSELNIENYDMFNEEQNIKFGCFYLNYLFSKFNNTKYVICAYNCGEGRLKRSFKGEKLPKETLNYYKKVSGYKKLYDFIT